MIDPSEHDLLDQIDEAIQAGKALMAFDAAARHYGCDPYEVCVTWRGQGTRSGVKNTPVVHYLQRFNESFNGVLKETEVARFDRRTKAWSIVDDGQALQHVSARLPDFFRVIVDLETRSVQINETEPEASSVPELLFQRLAHEVIVTRKTVLASIGEARDDTITKLYLHDGKKFAPWGDGAVRARVPNLLLRYSVPAGKPRYVFLDAVDTGVVDIAFGGLKRSASFIAAYVDTCQRLGVPAYEHGATTGTIRFERDPSAPGRMVYTAGNLELAVVTGGGCFEVHERTVFLNEPCDYGDGCPEDLADDCPCDPCPHLEREEGFARSVFFNEGTYQKNRIHLQELAANGLAGYDAQEFGDSEDGVDPDFIAALKHAAHATWELPV